MDRKKILKDGLLELYLLGELPAEQAAAVAKELQEDDALKAAYNAMEDEFERLAFDNSIVPPPGVRTSLEVAMQESPMDSAVRSLPASKEVAPKSRWPLMAAASLAALCGLGAFWLYTQWQAAEKNLQVLQEQTSSLQQRLVDLEENYQETNSRYRQINNPNVVPLLLVGNDKSPESRATVYVNHQTKEVVLNPQGLIPLDDEHTYQMWADVDGEMINMGVVPTDKEYIALTYIEKAESLNITIEPAGGNHHPTVERLISNIYL